MSRLIPNFSAHLINKNARTIVCGKLQLNRVQPKNEKQKQYVSMLQQMNPSIVVAHGVAGTGKTKLAVSSGIAALIEGKVGKIIITRPAVSVEDEQHGFLPGSLDDKMKPWLLPIMDAIHEHYSSVDAYDQLVKQGKIEIAPLAFMRGRTFTNSWIICDEAQNTTVSQMLMILTRVGENSKLVITGDLDQTDRQTHNNGLEDVIRLARSKNNIAPSPLEEIEFCESDVERSDVVKHVLKLYHLRKTLM